jgi:hypothetical protein
VADAVLEEEIARARAFARWMDRLVGIPGSEVGIGLDALVGALIPVGGDLLGGAAALYLIVVGVRARVPRVVLMRMLLNIGLDALIGVVPVLGDVADVFFQANARNVKLIERHKGGASSTRGDWLFVALTVGVALLAVAAPTIALFFVVQRLLAR